MLNKEYTRYTYIRLMENYISDKLSENLRYEALNCLERWLLNLANILSTPDPIFSLEKLNSEVTIKFISELKEKNIEVADLIIKTFIRYAEEYLKLTKYDSPDAIYSKNNSIFIGNYSRSLSTDRLNLLLTKGTLEEIGIMLLRYSCLIPRGQQWNVPLSVYELLVNKYEVTVEGFSSPINSQIIKVNPNLKFCSLFIDTDEKFGSIGSFFSQPFNNIKVMINPPYVPKIMNDMVNYLDGIFNDAVNLRCFITVPTWTDADYYLKLQKSEFLKKQITLKPYKHHYINSNNNNEKVIAKFFTTIFILSKGFSDIDYNIVEKEIISKF